jgi:tetratricopeptide (TPR) repeat protein
MNRRVLRRFVILMVILTVVVMLFRDVIVAQFDRPPGDYYTEVGSNRLVDGLYDQAMEEFNKALEESPDHRGALMGRALIYIQTERYEDAIGELGYLIERLQITLESEPDDRTGQGVLAAAFANRGIVHDRRGLYEEALADYIAALRTDPGAIEGPDIFQKILLGGDQISTVRDRAEYLHQQLQLPENERLLSLPELDEQQFMYKP